MSSRSQMKKPRKHGGGRSKGPETTTYSIRELKSIIDLAKKNHPSLHELGQKWLWKMAKGKDQS